MADLMEDDNKRKKKKWKNKRQITWKKQRKVKVMLKIEEENLKDKELTKNTENDKRKIK